MLAVPCTMRRICGDATPCPVTKKCVTAKEAQRSRKFLHFAVIQATERSTLAIKSLRIGSRIAGGNFDGVTYNRSINRAPA